MKIKKLFISILMVLCSVCVLIGCQKEEIEKTPKNPSISLNTISETLEIYDTLQLEATLVDSTDSIVWSSSASTVASVGENGVVTGVSVGTATITATAGDLTTTCVVNVVDSGYTPVLTVNNQNITVLSGSPFTISAAVTYGGKAFTGAVTYEWSISEGTEVVSVAATATDPSKAVITALSGGNAVVLVKATAVGVTMSKTVTVWSSIGEVFLEWGDGITETDHEYSLMGLYAISEGTYTNTYDLASQLIVSVEGDNTQNPEINWASADESIATVSDNGIVTGVGIGTTTITAMVNGISHGVNVTVERAYFSQTQKYVLEVFDRESYYNDGTIQYKANDTLKINSEVEKEISGIKMLLDNKEITLWTGDATLEAGENLVELDYREAFANSTKDDFGTGFLTVESDVAAWTYPAEIYTMILGTAKDVQNWLNVSVGLRGTGSPNGYFVLGNNITADATVSVAADGCWNYTPQILDGTVFALGASYNRDPYVGFGGMFDGRGYYIDKMDITVDSTCVNTNRIGAGFIPVLAQGGEIKQTAFTNCKFTSNMTSTVDIEGATIHLNRNGFVVAFSAGALSDIYVDVTYDSDIATKQVIGWGAVLVGYNNTTVPVIAQRCVVEMYTTNKVGYAWSMHSAGLFCGYQRFENADSSVQDIFAVNHMRLSNSEVRDEIKVNVSYIKRYAAFANADDMAKYAGEAISGEPLEKYTSTTGFNYKKNFVDDVTDSVWSIDAKGLPYFTSLGATPYTYSA